MAASRATLGPLAAYVLHSADSSVMHLCLVVWHPPGCKLIWFDINALWRFARGSWPLALYHYHASHFLPLHLCVDNPRARVYSVCPRSQIARPVPNACWLQLTVLILYSRLLFILVNL